MSRADFEAWKAGGKRGVDPRGFPPSLHHWYNFSTRQWEVLRPFANDEVIIRPPALPIRKQPVAAADNQVAGLRGASVALPPS